MRSSECATFSDLIDNEEFKGPWANSGRKGRRNRRRGAADVIGQARGGGRYNKVRWWGEMVNVLWERGNVAASMNLKDLFDQLAKKHDIATFCSFLMDNFNGEVHAHMLPRLGTNHSHLIPVEDYARLERAVADALLETVGADEARVLDHRK